MTETNHEPNQNILSNKPEPTLNDIGTRFEHLQDHYEALIACIEIMEQRKYISKADTERITKMKMAAEVVRGVIDAYSGYSESNVQYKLYHLLSNIPVNPEHIEGGRGTPLA